VPRLDQQRAEQQREIGDVDVGADAEVEQRLARDRDRRSQRANGGVEPFGAETVDEVGDRGQR
jgi:hypothetical protein